MAFDIGKPALALRRDIKQTARLLLEIHAESQEATRKITALGINYAVDQGTYLADADAAAFVSLLGQVISFLQTNAPAITKAADLGDNIL